MPRPVWTGTIAFGLVSVPIKLYTAVRDRSVRFHQLEQESGARIRYRRVSEQSGEEVPNERIIRGYDLGDGRYVSLSEEELEAAAPKATRTIDIQDFVELDQVDPVYFDSTYYLGPADPTASRAYALLHEAMRRSGRAAIGRFVLRSKERLVALRPLDGILALETLHFHDEIVDASFVESPGADEIADRELEMAQQLIDSLTTEWKPETLADTYRERVLEIVERKARGEEVVTSAAEPESADVIDLMSALRQSVEQRSKERSGDGSSPDASAGDANGDGHRASSGGGGDGGEARDTEDGLEAMTRQELYRQAQELGIRGRSEMSKEELVAALRESKGRKSA